MAIQAQDLRNLICGTLKFISPTTERDSSKRTIWQLECICGATEHGSKAEMLKYAGHTECPGHPLKGKEKPVDGFTLNPESRDTLEHAEAAAAWELKRNPVAPEQPKVKKNIDQSTSENRALSERLGLTGYHTTTVCLPEPLKMLNANATKVIFAENPAGDRILLHITLTSIDGKSRRIVSSRKKVPEAEWTSLANTLTGMNVTWRDRESRRASK